MKIHEVEDGLSVDLGDGRVGFLPGEELEAYELLQLLLRLDWFNPAREARVWGGDEKEITMD